MLAVARPINFPGLLTGERESMRVSGSLSGVSHENECLDYALCWHSVPDPK